MRLFLFFCLLPLALIAQSSQENRKGWRALTISDGLSQGMVYDLQQDQNGFVWIATKDGLNRYDGHNFLVFSHDPYNAYSVSDDAISALLIDAHGRLWVGTVNNGLNLYDAVGQRFYHIDISELRIPGGGNYEVRLLAEDLDGNIWVNTDRERLVKITLPQTLKSGFPDKPNFTDQVRFNTIRLVGMGDNGSAHQLQFRPDGTALVGTTYGMCQFNWRQLSQMQPINRPDGSVARWSMSSHTASGDLWFSSSFTHIHGWVHGRHNAIQLPEKTSTALVKFVDAKTVAIVTQDYLWLMSPEQLMAQKSLNPQDAITSLPANLYQLRTVTKDKAGCIWIGTAGYGLRMFNPEVNQFASYLPNSSLNYLYQDRQGRVYALRSYDYGVVDLVNNQLDLFLKNKLPRGYAGFIRQSRNGVFWVSNGEYSRRSFTLLKFSPDWKPLNAYPLPPQTEFGLYLNQTIEAKDGTLWIGATNGNLLKFDPATERFTVFSYKHLLPQSGTSIETHALYIDCSGTLWIGTPKGLIRAQNLQQTPTFSIFKNSNLDRQSLSNDVVSAVIDDPNSPLRYLWVATKGGGLERLDKQTGRFQHFTEAQGLPNKVVYGILADEFNNLWLSTNRGLAQFNPKTFTFRNFTKADGLQDDEFNTGSFFKGPTGALLFGGINGLTIFQPATLIASSHKPTAKIVGLRINNEPVQIGGPDRILSKSLEFTEELNLSHTQDGVTFEFAVMDFTNPAKNRYRYQMQGIDDKWVEAGTNRFANYAQLPSGSYTFQLSGSPDGQTWSEPVTLQIRVHPPFYRTWWAYLLYGIMLLGSFWLFYRIRTRRLLLEQRVAYEQKEASRLSELDSLKNQFFTNISHEFRTPLTLMLGPLADLKRRFPAEPMLMMMERNGQRLLSLINQLLDLSKLEAGQLNPEPEPGDLAAFFRTLAASFDSLATSRAVRFTFEQDKRECLANFDRDKLEKIVTNLLANAFKFTPAGKAVSLRVQYFDQGLGRFQVIVQDTGIGISLDNIAHIFERFYQSYPNTGNGRASGGYEGTGIGLALVHELVKVLDGKIDVESTEGVGTLFSVTLPLEALDPSPVINQAAQPTNEIIDNHSNGSIVASDKEVAHELPSVSSEKILLIIDDNTDMRAYIQSIFTPEYHILTAVDGQQGLEQATTYLPDLVICDLMMPLLDGFGFCRALKSQQATSHIPVVMLTAKATLNDRIEGFELGADDYLTKPFHQTELQVRVRNLIQQRQRLFAHIATLNQTQAKSPQQPIAEEPALLVAEQQFLDRLQAVVMKHIDDPNLTVESVAERLNLSRSQLHRKLKAIVNSSPTDWIREIRLSQAANLLLEQRQSVTQVAYAVGFESLSYFSKAFQDRYGVPPSQFGKANRN